MPMILPSRFQNNCYKVTAIYMCQCNYIFCMLLYAVTTTYGRCYATLTILLCMVQVLPFSLPLRSSAVLCACVCICVCVCVSERPETKTTDYAISSVFSGTVVNRLNMTTAHNEGHTAHKSRAELCCVV